MYLFLFVWKFERAIDKMRKHILELESQRIEQERSNNTLRMEKEASSRELDELRAELERHKKGTDAETELSKVQQNYQIMKEAYGKMRGEHLELIRSVSFLSAWVTRSFFIRNHILMFPHHLFFVHFPLSQVCHESTKKKVSASTKKRNFVSKSIEKEQKQLQRKEVQFCVHSSV